MKIKKGYENVVIIGGLAAATFTIAFLLKMIL